MLTACHGSARLEPEAPLGSAANPVVEIRREVVTVCPAELANAPAARPTPADGAVIRYNGPGGEHLAALVAWGAGLFQSITDARTQCPADATVPADR